MSNTYNYSIDLKNVKKTTQTVVLKQVSHNNHEVNIFEFPTNDIDAIIDALYKSKKSLNNHDVFLPNHEEEINPIILDTLVELFFSGISIKDLSSQYNLPEYLIKSNLERKGIVLFDEF
nr:hypothetical protein [uncultured Flavobacterium sp.]